MRSISLKQYNPVENWVTSVSISHSQSKATEVQYKRVWSEFSSFISKNAEQILADYAASEEHIFRRVHVDYIRSWIASLVKNFPGSESIKYLKQYLATRTNLTQDSLLFCSHTDPTKMSITSSEPS